MTARRHDEHRIQTALAEHLRLRARRDVWRSRDRQARRGSVARDCPWPRTAARRSLQRPAGRALVISELQYPHPGGAIMTNAQRENSGVLFRNDRKQSDKSPDYQGSLNVAGVEYQLSGWIKQGPKAKFMSLAIKPKNADRPERSS
jgi:hypothetical protein